MGLLSIEKEKSDVQVTQSTNKIPFPDSYQPQRGIIRTEYLSRIPGGIYAYQI